MSKKKNKKRGVTPQNWRLKRGRQVSQEKIEGWHPQLPPRVSPTLVTPLGLLLVQPDVIPATPFIVKQLDSLLCSLLIHNAYYTSRLLRLLLFVFFLSMLCVFYESVPSFVFALWPFPPQTLGLLDWFQDSQTTVTFLFCSMAGIVCTVC